MSFKDLTPANWTQPDPTSTQFGRQSVLLDEPLQMDGDDWARAFLALELKQHVPDETRELFSVARAAAVYGWFYYPLFFLAEEQLHRVVEAAARACYQQLGGAARQPRFAETIEFLIERGIIPRSDKERWRAARWLRNQASHPTRQSVTAPGAILRMFNQCAHDINRLFARARQVSDLTNN